MRIETYPYPHNIHTSTSHLAIHTNDRRFSFDLAEKDASSDTMLIIRDKHTGQTLRVRTYAGGISLE